MKAIVKYNYLLTRSPKLANSISAGIISAIGDYGAQLLGEYEEKKINPEHQFRIIDYRRSCKMFFFGFAFSGVPMLYWFKLCDNFKWLNTGGKWNQIIKKTLFTNLVYSPLINNAFLGYIKTVEHWGDGADVIVHESYKKMKQEFVPFFKNSLKVWITANFVIFAFIPDVYKVVFSNCIAACWNVYLSRLGHKHAEEVKPIDVKVDVE